MDDGEAEEQDFTGLRTVAGLFAEPMETRWLRTRLPHAEDNSDSEGTSEVDRAFPGDLTSRDSPESRGLRTLLRRARALVEGLSGNGDVPPGENQPSARTPE